jgi:hypothetical protein
MISLPIQKEATIASIQQVFHAYFPFLKLEFYRNPHEVHALSKESEHLPSDMLVSTIPSFKESGVCMFSPSMKTGAFEQLMWDTFGLSIQIFRKSGSVWLQSALTDDWTLEKQNTDGQKSSEPQRPEVTDYGLRDID